MSKRPENQQAQNALDYHSQGRPGKIEVVSTKATHTAKDLSLAYSPGVAHPCLEIAKEPNDAYRYTAKGNLVGVISNGTAVLGLGNIGALAGKPVMEGKGVLFKRFADIDVFDIEVNEESIEGMVKVVKALEPTFGGVNLEDIKAPECFEIERILCEQMNIPVFHDDQHGTAIIASAAFINALEITNRKISEVKVVFSGAGAASIACAKLFIHLGVKPQNLLMTDSQGVIYKGRPKGMNKYKEEFACETSARTLGDAMKEADTFIGCSARGVLTKEMVASMAKKPIIFAMANPDPEILPDEVREVRDDAIVATGRSDYPNQVNNVLGFPFIFRGALDVRATKINMEMKLAAVKALADLAKEEVPDEVKQAYADQNFKFGPDYLIPKPFDTRALTRVAPAVAKAAMESSVARIEIKDLREYANQLQERLGRGSSFFKAIRGRLDAKVNKMGRKVKIVFAEGTNTRVLMAVKELLEDEKIEPILLGRQRFIHKKMDNLGLEALKELQIINPIKHPEYENYFQRYCLEKQRDGVSMAHAEGLMAQKDYFGAMLVRDGQADVFLNGPTLNYPECLIPLLNVVGTKDKAKAAGIYIMIFKNRILFLADCTAQISPDSEDLANIAISAANFYQGMMNRAPRVAFLSYSNFGSNKNSKVLSIKKAVELAKQKKPDLIVDGEMQADVAVNKNILDKLFNFSSLDGPTDILIFPELNSANISYKLLGQLSDVKAIGPFLVPLNKAVNIIPRTATVAEIVNMATLTALMS